MNLWPHQHLGLTALRAAVAAGETKICITSPTGGGKSRMMFELLLSDAVSAAVYTDRRMLCEQLTKNMTAAGIEHGIVASGMEPSIAGIQLCMAQTMVSKCVKGLQSVPDVDYCIWDEAHKMGGETLQRLREQHWRSIDIGFTATPLGIGHIYEHLIVAGTNSELRECGALVPAFHFGPDEPDIKWVGTVKVDDGECGLPKNKRQEFAHRVFGRVVENYLAINPERKPTVLFAPGVAESIWFAQELCKQGIPAAHIDGENVWHNGELFTKNQDVINDVKEMLADGTLSIVCNRFVLREGIDWPFVEHGIFATIFGSLTSYLQAGGRFLRACPSTGKTRCCVARGTLILTNRGEIPVQEVTRNDLVWDGIEFVSHDGACCNGIKEAIEWNGLQLTPDHKVLTNDGWKEAAEAGGWKPIIGGVGGKPVRTADDSNPYYSRKRLKTRSGSGLQFLRQARVEAVSQNYTERAKGVQSLHKKIRISLSRVDMETCAASKAEMPMSAKQHVPSLWRSRYRVSVCINIRRGLLDCEKSRDPETSHYDNRSHRQQRTLRTGKSKVGYTYDAISKSRLCVASQVQNKVSICNVFGRKPEQTQEERIFSEGNCQPMVLEVWDILNAGPRNRYTANGLIVANCIQDHGGNWHRHGSLNADREWELGYDDRIVAGIREKMLREKKEREPIVCPKCNAVRLSGPKCFMCGHQHDSRIRIVLQQDGTLREIKGDIYKARRTLKRTAELETEWVSRVKAVRKSQKPSVMKMTFSQLTNSFARDHNWAHPPEDLPFMPTHIKDWFRPVRDVPEDRLTR